MDDVFKALADPNRRKLLDRLFRRDGQTLGELCERVDKRVVNRRVIEALIRGGAFDRIDDHRARLLASVGIALTAAEPVTLHSDTRFPVSKSPLSYVHNVSIG